MIPILRSAGLVCCTGWCLLLLTAKSGWAQEPLGSSGDDARETLSDIAERILLSERCGECHAAEFEVWEATEHATGFDTLHTLDSAKEIYRSLGLRLIKRGTEESTPACLNCHYTPVLRRDQLRAGAGVTCESCHGPAREWISIHNSYGVPESDFQKAALLETAEHREERLAESRAAGMRRPSDLYDVAANCFGCHTVPNEEIVNTAGHSPGTNGFELVEKAGEIRHNFLESYKTADGRTNAERPREWKRLMYIVGRALDLEYAVRGVAAATEEGRYFAAMSDRAGYAIDELYEINDRASIPAVGTMIATFEQADLAINNGDQLQELADVIQQATKQFIAAGNGGELAAVDPLWDPTAEEVASPVRITTDTTVAPVALPEPAFVADAPVVQRPDPSPPGASNPRPDPVTPVRATAPVIETLTRPPWREVPAHRFERVPCGSCHEQQDNWWRSDPHSSTIKPLRSGDPEVLAIARAYGVPDGEIVRGNQTCVWCHGTADADSTRRIRAGVGCQRCHGAGEEYLEPHEDEDYARSVSLGLTDLRNPAIQAATCAGCHYITEPGLINAGHPTGVDFDISTRIDDIVHWGSEFGRDQAPVDRRALAAAHATVVDARGPAPDPMVVAPPPVSATAAASAGGSSTSDPAVTIVPPEVQTPTVGATAPSVPAAGGASTLNAVISAPPSPPAEPRRPPRSEPPGHRARAARTELIDDPGFDALVVSDDASVEATLDALRRRLEEMYGALNP